MAAPVFVKAGTGVVIASGSAACTLASTTAGNIIVLQVLRDGTASAVTLSAITNLENLAGTDNTLTDLALLQPVGSPTAGAQSLYIGRSLGGTVSVTVATAGDDLYFRLYEFSGAITGTTLAAVTESIANGVGTGTTVSDTGVTTTAADRLALQFVAVNDDLAVGPFTGMTGGVWAEAVAEFASATGTDGCIQLQTGLIGGTVSYAGSTVPSSFGNTAAHWHTAIKFTAPATGTIGQCVLSLKANGVPLDDLVVEIRTDASGVPSSTVVGTPVTLNVTSTTFSSFSPAVAAPVTSGSVYWIVVRRTTGFDGTNFYGVETSSSADPVGATYSQSTLTWTANATLHRAHTLFVPTGAAGTINGGTFAMVSGGWGVVGLALIPPAAGPATLERQAALAAAGLIAAIGREQLARLAALNATGAVTASGVKVTPAVTVERSAAFAATAAISAVGRETLARAAAVTAAASISSAGREQLARLAELAAAGNVSVAGQVESGAATLERAAALAATAGVATAGQEMLARAAAVSAAATISSTGQVGAAGATIERTAALTATAAITADGAVNPPVEVPARRRGGRLIEIRKPALVTAAVTVTATARVEVAAVRGTAATAAVAATAQLFTASIRVTTAGAGLVAVSTVAATATRTTYGTATFQATVRMVATGTTTRSSHASLTGIGRVYATATHWPKPTMSNRQRDEELLLLIGGNPYE